jgi:hypothetical protein
MSDAIARVQAVELDDAVRRARDVVGSLLLLALTLLKFRTMRVDAEADGPLWATERDPRGVQSGGSTSPALCSGTCDKERVLGKRCRDR